MGWGIALRDRYQQSVAVCCQRQPTTSTIAVRTLTTVMCAVDGRRDRLRCDAVRRLRRSRLDWNLRGAVTESRKDFGFGTPGVDQAVRRRELAYRISAGRVAGQVIRLAPTSAEILRAPLATAARLLHPVFAPESVEAGRLHPDVGERSVPHVVELQVGNRMRRMARQREAVGTDDDEALAPPVHAGLRIVGVIIRRHEQNFHTPLEPLLRPGGERTCAVELLTRRHQSLAIQQRPAEV